MILQNILLYALAYDSTFRIRLGQSTGRPSEIGTRKSRGNSRFLRKPAIVGFSDPFQRFQLGSAVLLMAAAKSGTLDYWRNLFRSADYDIFQVIEYAIAVAASDKPKEFRLRRGRIAEKLFSSRLSRCFGCNRVELAVPHENEEEGEHPFDGTSKESKVNSSPDDTSELMNRPSNYSYDEAEALTNVIEEETQIAGEVLRIKEILSNHREESEDLLFESLRRLQLMVVSVEILKATEIGRAVNAVRKHGSKKISHLARTLINEWKAMVDEWVANAPAIASSVTGGTPDSVNPSGLDEEIGLPSPPLDEGAFLATQTTSMELSQFFDGMDEDGNPQSNRDLDKNHRDERKPTSATNIAMRQLKPHQEVNVPKEDKILVSKQEATNRQSKPMNTDVGPGRPKIVSEDKAGGNAKLQQQGTKVPQRNVPASMPRKPPTNVLQDFSDELSVHAKLEAAKRKLHEGYQQAENAKKQRTVQFMDFHDLPKPGNGHRNLHLKLGIRNRHGSHGHR
ncbi:hypothetical protein ACLOJK_024801 [Asimina triloba]